MDVLPSSHSSSSVLELDDSFGGHSVPMADACSSVIASTSLSSTGPLGRAELNPAGLELDDDLHDIFGADQSFVSKASDQPCKKTAIQCTTPALRPCPPSESFRREIRGTSFTGKAVTFGRRLRKRSTQSRRALDEAATSAQASDELGELASSFLEMPIHQLMADVRDQLKQERASKAQAAQDPQRIISGPLETDQDRIRNSRLWTDVYRPKRFTDLMGDERTHRNAMTWLKEWDNCVFKTGNKKPKRGDTASRGPGHDKENAPIDPYGRPQEKILLLSGPPGLGKTTLAHVLATQAGYRVHEINASDDRTGRIVTDRIRDAIECRAISVQGGLSSDRPTCVIIDEIDGAGGSGENAFVKQLVKFVQDGSMVKHNKGKGKKTGRPLLRPIICICNDLYANVLRPLRPFARIIRFGVATAPTLLRRLRTVCDQEGLVADAKHLTKLVEVAGGDMRNCLNTLQFIKSKGTRLDEQAIRSSSIGLKDTGTSPGAVWDHLFRIPTDRKGAPRAGRDGSIFEWLLRDVSTCGEYDKIAQGCFEWYPEAKLTTDVWLSILRAHQWLGLYDLLDTKIKTHQDYELLAYVPYTLIAWNPLFASITNRPIERAKADYEAFVRQSAHREVLDSFCKPLKPTIKSTFLGNSVVVELAAYLTRIISPDLKPINSQIVKADEKQALKKLVAIMLDLGLSYLPERTEDGQLSYKLDPAVDVWVHWEGKRAPDIPAARYSTRHAIACQIDAERITRAQGTGDGSQATSTASTLMSAYGAMSTSTTAGAIKSDSTMDFFGRSLPSLALNHKQSEVEDDSSEPASKRLKVVYKFHEGFSNAVRVPITISNLFKRAN
ncbi:uncharacterized protein L969DRAFT_91277 [Mixia osmundae IAM 14324]|uniref:AAA+ ATPase domain-containing protein n=1 Tax=Mixia osmundae (strain CBS 9802 / IAM 14324 / JCM 22182 / KY 12970) TaxID=764103 RepID=G7DSQ3_MIXOS|nr:uncharacterized protein L969DRAFT_91277 [Mixia osmundae IAM 14324]KEI41794.1 hypothetical protein L969DRAFT_91277 [Mixia osmundae IAM 14324]GAA93611.1 hypothetical protein E5Q_00255 [Mixia osmundae IAM 14324]